MEVRFIIVCFLVTAYAKSVQLSDVHHWAQFKAEHGKKYANAEEEQHRFKSFLATKQFIQEHNAKYENGDVSYTVELNKFSDLTNDEFNVKYNKFRHSNRKPSSELFTTPIGYEAPTSVDWRDNGSVTPVKDQGDCGSCWAFSTTGSIEGQHQLSTGNLVSLSEQELIECSKLNHGCEGGSVDEALFFVTAIKGIETEAMRPYTGKDGICKSDYKNNGAKVTGYVDIVQGSETHLTNAIAKVGPISVAIDASQPSFKSYSSGVYDEPACHSTPADTNHAVLAVGYGSLNGKDYYIVKNSWDENWGQSGYILMSRNSNNQCGIASLASYPKV